MVTYKLLRCYFLPVLPVLLKLYIPRLEAFYIFALVATLPWSLQLSTKPLHPGMPQKQTASRLL